MTLPCIAKRFITMSVPVWTKVRGIMGRWQGASEAQTRSGLQRASNEARDPKDKRIVPNLNGIWNLHGLGRLQGEPAARCQKKKKLEIRDYARLTRLDPFPHFRFTTSRQLSERKLGMIAA